MPPSVETPSVETGGGPRLRLGQRAGTPSVANSGGPRLRLGQRAGTPSVATSGRLVASTAPAATIRCGRFCRSLDNLAKLVRPVHFENPAPVVAEPQPLADRVAPDDRLDAFHRMRCRCGIQAGGLAGGIPADPVVKLCRRFDDHSRIISGRESERKPGRGNPPFLISQLSVEPPDRRNPRETRGKDFRLDSTCDDAILG